MPRGTAEKYNCTKKRTFLRRTSAFCLLAQIHKNVYNIYESSVSFRHGKATVIYESEVRAMTDEKLLRMLKKDVRTGFEELIRQYAPYIGTIVRSRLGTVTTADERTDITSDIFAEILSSYREERSSITSLKAYISVIAVRHCIGVFRKKHLQADRVDLEALAEPSEEEAKYERTELIELLNSLGEPDCEIFLRKYFLGQRSAEIAEAMKLRTNTVDQKISRGLKKLRDMLKEG